MNTDKDKQLISHKLSEQVIGTYYSVYNELGFGFLESVYESAFALALRAAGLQATQQAPIEVTFRGCSVGEFRADILVEGLLVVEIKAVSQLIAAHETQLLNYLKATGIQVGLLFNFCPRPEFRRRVF